MAEMFSATVDAKALLAMMDRVGPSLDWHCKDVARETAYRIADDAKRRVARRSGETAQEIHADVSFDGLGYVVLAYDIASSNPPVDIYLEYGTNYMYKRPFFMSAALLEEGPHWRRLNDRIQKVLDDLGR